MTIKSWKNCLVNEKISLVKAIEVLNDSALQIALIVDDNQKLKGVITDGDFRRAILKGLSIESSVSQVMNTNPTSVRLGESKEKVLQLMKAKAIHQIPVLDDEGIVRNLYTIDSLLKSEDRENEVILMVGGLGSRLKDLTKDCPKPLLKVGGRPLIETMLLNLKEQGFSKFIFCVNYMSDRLKDYFGDGKDLGVKIRYVEEHKRLGTAGALRLADINSTLPVIVMNGDILTNLNFCQLVQFHVDGNYEATMAIRQFEVQVPYGVIETNGTDIIGMQEKPIQTHFINAGVYVFNSDVFKLIPEAEYFDMNNFFDELIAHKRKIGAFPVHEYWIDIGHIQDYEKANIEFPENFKKK